MGAMTKTDPPLSSLDENISTHCNGQEDRMSILYNTPEYFSTESSVHKG